MQKVEAGHLYLFKNVSLYSLPGNTSLGNILTQTKGPDPLEWLKVLFQDIGEQTLICTSMDSDSRTFCHIKGDITSCFCSSTI